MNHDEIMAMTMSSIATAPVCQVPLEQLLTGDSPRLSGTNADHVRALAQAEGPLPPILVRRPTMQVLDGAHRVAAARLRKVTAISARFFEGEDRVAFMVAVKANVEHGLPLALAERAAAAERILRANPLLSDRTIARTAGLSAVTVGAIRQRSTDGSVQSNVRLGMDGKVRPLNSAGGRLKASTLIEDDPAMPLREVARKAGISLATAHDVRRRVLRGEDPVPPRQQDARRRPDSARRTGRVMGTREREAAIRALVRDPALRYSDIGRATLTWLSAHVLGIERGRQFVGSLPGHCLERIAEVARGCAEEWHALATEAENRLNCQDDCGQARSA